MPAHAEVSCVLVVPVPDKLMVLGELVALLATELLPVKAPVEVGLKVALKRALLPVIKVIGKESPLRLKPAPVTVTSDTVTLLVPVFVRVTIRALLFPKVTFPKLWLRGLAERRQVVLLPVPDSVRIVGELVALLATEMLPVKVPNLVGARVTLKTALLPDVKVRGKESPPRLKPAPIKVACETVTLLVPVFVRVTFSALLLPTTMLPKLRLTGLAVRRWVTLLAVPASDILAGEFVALLATEMLPLNVPAEAAVKVALKVPALPGCKVSGKEMPLVPKPVPATVTRDTVTLPVPVFVRVTFSVPLLPTLTFPKLRLRGLALRR